VIITRITQDTGLQTFYGTVPYALLWAGSRAILGKIIVGVTKRQNNYVIFIINSLKMWLRATKYNLADRELETYDIRRYNVRNFKKRQ